MIGVGLTRTRLSTRLGLSIGERLATLTNTLADSTLPISAIPGLLDRINALDDRLTALGLAAADPDVADAIAAVLIDLAEAIDAIDLHRALAVVLPALEAAMTQLEEAAANPGPQPSGQWFANSTDIFANGTDWFADGARSGGGGTTPVQNFSFGPANGAAGEGGSEVLIQNFSFGTASNQPSEESTLIQNFAFGPANGSAGEGADLIQNFTFGAATTQPSEGAALIQNFAFGAATTTPSE